MNKETKIQLIIIVILSIIQVILLTKLFTNKQNNKMSPPEEIKIEKETNISNIDKGKVVTQSKINLNDYNTNITIKEKGEYEITGTFTHSIFIDSKEEVILNLNNVNIESTNTAAIGNISENNLVINLLENTTNTLKDGGSSELDGCIYSTGHLIIEGKGKLNIYGNQTDGEGISTTDNDITINGGVININSNDDGLNAGGDKGGVITINDGNIYIKAGGDGIDSNKDLVINGGSIYTIGSPKGGNSGIDTDGIFEINGGKVISLGSDMLQNPNNTSKQKYISFDLNNKINKESKISIRDQNNNEITTFTADETFKTLIVSTNKLKNETYNLYIDDTKTEYSKTIK